MFGQTNSVLHATSNSFTCECIDVDFMNFQHGRETAQDERARQQQEDETMTRQKEESTQDEMTTQRQDVTEIEAVEHEHEKGGDKVIHVKHQGKLQSMAERDLWHLTIKHSDVHTVHGGRIMDLEATGQL